MKLLFVYRFCGLGGVETSILNKLEALQEHGIEGYVLFSEFYGVGGTALARHPRVTIGLQKEELRDFLSKDYDVISVIDYPAFLDTLAEAQVQARTIFESHASFPPALDYFYSKLHDPSVSAIVVPSQFNKRMVKRAVPTNKTIVVIPNPIDKRRFFPRSLRTLQPRFRQLSGGPVIIWLGRIEDEKNPLEFIKISEGILQSRTDVQFMIVGDTFDYTDYKEMLERAIKEEWRKHFTFYQSIPYDEMPEVYALAAETGGCLVSTSFYESAPMTFIEAMSCKCPVVSTDVGGVREIISDNVTGRLYSVGDVGAGVNAVVELFGGSENTARSKVIERGFIEVATKHSLTSVGRQYKHLIDSLRHRPMRNTDIIPGLVSTIIPVYNRSMLLREAVASVLSQTYQKIEVIIIDDGSTDDTAAVCDQLARENSAVRVLHLPHQGRPGLVREAGRLRAKGQYIQYLDSDDVLLPTKFEKMVGALEAHPQCDIAYCYTRRYRRGDAPIDVPTELTGETFHTMLPAFLSRRFWHTSTPLYRRAICDKAGPWSDLPFWEDIENDIRIATLGPQLYHCKEFLTDFRDHEMGRISSKGFYHDPERLRFAAKGARLIYQHVKKWGMRPGDEHLRFFIEDVSLIYKRCKELGLDEEAQRCADLVSDATGTDNQEHIGDFTVCAVIEPQVSVLTARPGEPLRFPVRIVNKSAITFRPGEFAFELSYHLLAVDGTMVRFENPRTLFEQPLRPGEERLVDMFIRAPDTAGFFYLEIDIVWGPITWLKSRGNPTALVKLVVGENIRDGKWWFQAHEGNVAKLIFPPDYPERVRIAVSKLETTTFWHIQLNQARLSVKKDAHYEVMFRARADRARSIGLGFARAHEPWDGLGLYKEIALTSEWQSFQEEFVATDDDNNARIHFDVGGSDVPVELSSVTLRSLPDGQVVEAPEPRFLERLRMDIGVNPLSYVWGTDRGLPVHRYYVEQFLAEFVSDIHGHCLEFQDDAYTTRFGGSAVVTLDILHIDDSNPRATLVGDLTKPNNLPTNQFDCIICTHVLHVIFDVERAVQEIFRILKPGGVLLVAVPHVSMCDPNYHEMWRFTPEGLERLLGRVFGMPQVAMRAYGNSLTAAGEIRGMVAREFSRSELDQHDPRFAVEVCARAVK